MEFTQAIKNQAFTRSRGKCECQRTTHGHAGRCNAKLAGDWHVHSKISLRSKDDLSLSNSEVLCGACHRARQLLGVF
ncbi:MAG: hypothetical protein Q8916_02720 [Bacteroidota bacterium]|nr:hypothetical protein [Bacteroidota bacterium]MDP4229301.1 hypothetical protein [Bacteroidota bacterium]MDP4234874.1 hypothetical protein [Bacteroidota bacterium]